MNMPHEETEVYYDDEDSRRQLFRELDTKYLNPHYETVVEAILQEFDFDN